VNKEHFLVFPSMQQQKLFRLRGHLSSHLWEGIVFTLKVLKYYCPLYFLIGKLIVDTVAVPVLGLELALFPIHVPSSHMSGAYPRNKLMNTFNLHLR